MSYQVSYLVALVGALGLVNLVLTVGVVRRQREVIRRLREHHELLVGRSAGPGTPPSLMLAPGRSVDDFEATTVDGAPLSRDRLAGRTLVGFFSAHCSSCREQLPSFLARAGRIPGGRAQALAVVVGPAEKTADMAARLATVARVVSEVEHGPVGAAFEVEGFPAFALLDGDLVTASAVSVDQLPDPRPNPLRA